MKVIDNFYKKKCKLSRANPCITSNSRKYKLSTIFIKKKMQVIDNFYKKKKCKLSRANPCIISNSI